MPFNTALADALVYAPQLGTLSASTRPTSTAGTAIWNRSYDMIRLRLKRAGVSSSFTSSSAGEGWAKDVEAHLTSGRTLLAKGSVGTRAQGSRSGEDTTARTLIRLAMDELDRLDEDRQFREALIADGGRNNLPKSGWAQSDWSRGKDPDLDTAFGGDDFLYVPGTPAIQDGEPL